MSKEDHLAEERDALWYPSEVDAWLAVILIALPLVAFGTLIWALVSGEGLVGGIFASLFVSLLYFGLVFPMRYGFAERHLLIRHGIMRQRIPYRDIGAVYPTRNPLSSPALSTRRLAIQFGEGFFRTIMISPVQRDSFLDILALRAGLEREGDSLLPPAGDEEDEAD